MHIKLRYMMQSIACALSVLAIAACSMDERVPAVDGGVRPTGRDNMVSETMVQGVVRVKVSEELASQLENSLNGKSAQDFYRGGAPGSWNQFISAYGVTKVERTFPYAGVFEERTREEGLHLWYDVHFDESEPLTRAGNGISSIEGIGYVEYLPKIQMSYEYEISYDAAEPASVNERQESESQLFDDPGLANQWHYYNDGSFSEKAVPGADINVLPVWREGITGRSDVVVVITDMGVDFAHEDLRDNMWNGSDEQGNIIYGYNFYDDTYKINPGNHATHIAGTIAAVNNNGTGVCGIAGGDFKNGVLGVKIMSCQIASPDGDVAFSDGQGGVAIKWAADHGAVISQNSWQYTQGFYNSMIESDREAFDYFIKYAGLDENGVQTGPMAGGVIFFACGNAKSEMAYPQSYEKVIAVSSIKSDFTAYGNNNYGAWVDIAAPGGDRYKDGEDAIYSTLPQNGEGEAYGYMHGTSMASPHAAGVAALIVSHFGGPGFTAQELKFRMFSTLRPMEQYNSPSFSELLGHGLVDAAAAILGSAAEGPEAVSDLTVEVESNKLLYQFTVPSGERRPVSAYLLLSDAEIDESNYQKVDFEMIDIRDCNPGDLYSGEYFSSAFDTVYRVAVITIDESGGVSKVSNNVEVTVGENHAPEIEAVDGTSLRVSNRDRLVARFVIKDEDKHDIAVSFDYRPNHTYYEFDSGNDTLYLTINGKTASLGTYNLNLTASDPYGMSSTVAIQYEIFDNDEESEQPDEPEPPVVEPDVETMDFVLYPNPVVDNVYIKSSAGAVSARVKLYSQTGALLQDEDMTVGDGAPLDMTAHPAGTYLFRITYQDRTIEKSVVKL